MEEVLWTGVTYMAGACVICFLVALLGMLLTDLFPNGISGITIGMMGCFGVLSTALVFLLTLILWVYMKIFGGIMS